jgi:hypothetical protein
MKSRTAPACAFVERYHPVTDGLNQPLHKTAAVKFEPVAAWLLESVASKN